MRSKRLRRLGETPARGSVWEVLVKEICGRGSSREVARVCVFTWEVCEISENTPADPLVSPVSCVCDEFG